MFSETTAIIANNFHSLALLLQVILEFEFFKLLTTRSTVLGAFQSSENLVSILNVVLGAFQQLPPSTKPYIYHMLKI